MWLLKRTFHRTIHRPQYDGLMTCRRFPTTGSSLGESTSHRSIPHTRVQEMRTFNALFVIRWRICWIQGRVAGNMTHPCGHGAHTQCLAAPFCDLLFIYQCLKQPWPLVSGKNGICFLLSNGFRRCAPNFLTDSLCVYLRKFQWTLFSAVLLT